jgi:Tfp pilus assembly protein PilF
MMIQRNGVSARRSARAWRGLLLGAAALLLSAQAAQAEWRRAETANFLVYGEGSENDLRRHAERLERFDALLRRQFNLSPMEGVRKLPVYLVYTNSDLRQVNPHLGESAAGFYSASETDVYSVLNRRGGDDILFHEYAHHFMFQNFPGGYPGWFTEGFAEFFMTASVDNPDKVTLGYFNPGRLRTLNEVEWIPVEQLLTRRPQMLDDRRVRWAFYAQSWLLTHYLFMDAERRRGLDAYLAAVAQGTPPVEALQTHLGHTPDSLEKALKAYLRGTMNYAEVRMDEVSPAMTFQTLPASADRMLLDSLHIRYPVADEDTQALLQKVRADAARFPGDRLALVTLGRAEMNWGDAAAGEAALEQALAVAPDDPEALQLLARARIKAGDDAPAARAQKYVEAQGYLARALQADPTDYRIYLALARIRRIADSYPNDNDLQTWRLAVAYAPQVMSARAQAADALLRVGQREEAAVMLAPVANNPHGGEHVERARALLDQIRTPTSD